MVKKKQIKTKKGKAKKPKPSKPKLSKPKEKKVKEKKIKESPLFWPVSYKRGVMEVLDETQIPQKVVRMKVRSVPMAVKVIKDMKTRAFGQFLVVLSTFLLMLDKNKKMSDEKLLDKIRETAHALNKSRPTFPFAEVTSTIVRWAVMAIDSRLEIYPFVRRNLEGYLETVRVRRLKRVEKIAELIADGDSILTHCNVSGELAMAGAICRSQKKDIHVFATETRPYFQGAKLTTWEMELMKVPVTLVADNAVGSLMVDRLVNKVIVGSDRSCANGDFANKIGTYQIACCAQKFGVPFYALTQPSDKVRNGKDIPIEIRNEKELLYYKSKKYLRGKVKGFYPGFDVVPAGFLSAPIPIQVSENA